ncbi:MAG: hypothetical protein ABW060_12785 [Solirubrobacteraceae bacterium]
MTETQESTIEHIEEELSWAGLAIAYTLRAAEVALIALIALLVCPPLMIATVVVVAPLAIIAVVVAALAAVIALPVLVVRRLHRHRTPDAHALVHRLARLGREDSALAASGARRLVARVQAKLHVEHEGRTVPPS